MADAEDAVARARMVAAKLAAKLGGGGFGPAVSGGFVAPSYAMPAPATGSNDSQYTALPHSRPLAAALCLSLCAELVRARGGADVRMENTHMSCARVEIAVRSCGGRFVCLLSRLTLPRRLMSVQPTPPAAAAAAARRHSVAASPSIP